MRKEAVVLADLLKVWYHINITCFIDVTPLLYHVGLCSQDLGSSVTM